MTDGGPCSGARRVLLVLLGALLWPAAIRAEPPSGPLEPLLWDAMRDARPERPTIRDSLLPDGRLRVLARLAPGTSPRALAAFSPEAAIGSVVPLRIAPRQLAALGRVAGVLQVEACRPLRPHLDRSRIETGAPTAWQQMGLDGTGVVVGVVDTGLDFRHEDFQTSSGKTRLLYLLDFSEKEISGSTVNGHGARAYSAAEIDAQLELDRALGPQAPSLVGHRDISGHGTHVMGIAAGNGRAAAPGYTQGTYLGVAPGATLVAVQAAQLNDSAFHDADVLHAVQFVFERAEAERKPAVVNLSIGTQLGPHDGTSNLDQAISALLGKPGRVIVVSAGNDGGRDNHAMGWPALEGESQVVLEIPAYKPGQGRDLVHLELWYDRTLDLELTSPGGRTLGPAGRGQSVQTPTDEGLVKLLNAPTGPYAGNGRNQAVVLLERQEKTSPASGRWTLVLRGQAQRFDLWLVNSTMQGSSGERPRLLGPVSADTKLTSPATAMGVIAVGAYNTRSIWDSRAGRVGVSQATAGYHAFFSSTGPTQDGRFHPDVSAPGQFVISALSRHAYPFSTTSSFYVPGMPYALWCPDQVRGLLRGTSQAAPHVAGVAALLLQRKPDLTSEQVRELLRAGARSDGLMVPGQGWSPRWGFGKVDAARSLAALDAQSSSGLADPRTSTVGLNRDLVPPGSQEAVTLSVIPRDATGRLLGAGQQVTIRASDGSRYTATHVAYGRYQVTFVPQGRLGTELALTALVNDVPLSYQPRIFLAQRREHVGWAFHAHGGGCMFFGFLAVPSQPRPGVGSLMLVALALARMFRQGQRQRPRTRGQGSRGA